MAYTQDLLHKRGIDPQRFILVQKPYMERRTFATFKKSIPDKEIFVTSPPCEMLDYPLPHLPMERVINIMVGDLQRIMIYPEKGFQIEQPVPDAVMHAYEELIRLGFDQHLI